MLERIANYLEVPISSLLSFHMPIDEIGSEKTTFEVVISRISNMTEQEKKKLLKLLNIIENFHNN